MSLFQRRCPRDPDAFPAFQLFFLAIVRLAEPIALTSIFPYAWALVKHFQFGDEADASFYAGILISSFSLAEALMGMYWGRLSDRIGRKPVLLIGCIGTVLSLVVVGLARNIWVALLGRIVGGLLNGNIGVIQTMVGELVKKPEHEPRAYSIMPFVWSIGTIIGPAIGGTFADPHSSFPDLVPLGSLFDQFPYLLPNLLCALLLLISIVLGYFLLEETHPELQRPSGEQKTEHDHGDGQRSSFVSDETPLLETSDALKRPAVDLRAETYGTFRDREDVAIATDITETSARGATAMHQEKPAEVSIFSRRILAVVLALAIFSYHSMVYDSTLPIFFEDDRVLPFPGTDPNNNYTGFSFNPLYYPGGLGLSLRAAGIIMAVNGAIALFVQAVVFPLAAAWLGVGRLFMIVTILHPLAYVVVPALLYVPQSLLYPAIYACLALRNLFAILVYPLLLILIKEATPSSSVLGTVNGMAASAGAACRMVAPPIAGYLYALGSRFECTALAWYGGAFVALIGALQCFSVDRAPPVIHIESFPAADDSSEDSVSIWIPTFC
ncbi:hypothetical protein SEPCBS57363_002458 [Sporothrix epigloea]|uniref:Major facilitator superfamily (MFS) profile domain-containing protein n=1 Tax=Sporothrix epigloea TaxID=1892477 RepID=A0ABP0DHR2_9PEZI